MGSASKKNRARRRAGAPWPIAARRWAWFESQPDLDPRRRLVYIDETGASTKMAFACVAARSVANVMPCRIVLHHGHWKTTTFTAGLRLDGLTAPMLLDGPMNGESRRCVGVVIVAFLAHVEQVLVPTLVPG